MSELGYFNLFICVTLVLPDLKYAADGLASWSAARQDCSSRLPDLSSVRDGSLLRQLENHESTWIDVHLEKAPWTWHLDEKPIEGDKSCVAVGGAFNEKFHLAPPVNNSEECLLKCESDSYSYAALSQSVNKKQLCYCGNEIPHLAEDTNCAEQCQNWPSICGKTGYARVITTADAYEVGLNHKGSATGTNDRCAVLAYKSSSARFIQADCSSKKQAICASDNGVSWGVHLSENLLNWFEAQTFCEGVEATYGHRPVQLSASITVPLSKHDDFNTADEYWTQSSAFQFNPTELGTESPTLAIGISVAALIVVLTGLVVVVALYIHRNRQNRPTPKPTGKTNQTENVYDEITEMDRHPYEPIGPMQPHLADEPRTQDPVSLYDTPRSSQINQQNALYENAMRVSKVTSSETGT
ncbi:hypothetical protein CAPTEDRAFT_224332 [Capitella teleta]|uniref:WSC domain-containing protein n=1 Tax=Capitella teleta TaxID=283909 RepID=R7VBS0_CAPTE|nr:hypothetical protein CAPTEDRAFT_224332 [Capitella teleta]|eukprot:ELU13135.1 hypothetical protein CAPTEDRAFT_224332 [Capitella teleta]